MAPVASELLAALAGLPNAAEPLPGWIIGGQPTAEQLQAFKTAGGEVVLDSRDPMEPRTIDEQTVAREMGLAYVNVPIVHGAVTQDTMRQMHETLKRLKGKKVLLHCSSGNRTAAGLIPYLMLDEGIPEEQAIDIAMRSGLRSAELMEIALEYVKDSRS